MNQDSTFTIKLPDDVYKFWDELGVSHDQRKSDIDQMKKDFSEIVTNYLFSVEQKCKSTRSEIEQIQEAQRKAMRAFGITEEEVKQTIAPIQPVNLLQQLTSSKTSYENFKSLCADRIKKLENLVHHSVQLFDMLGIPEAERGEFNEVGDSDYSRERLDRFKVKLEELQKELDARKQKITLYRKEINDLQKQICFKLSEEETSTMNSTIYSTQIIESMENILKKLNDIRTERIAKLNQLAVTMTHLWDLLEIPEEEKKAFLDKHSTLSDDVFSSCEEEIRRLEELRDEKLPLLIQKQMEELQHLYDTLHIAVEGRMIIDENKMKGNEAVEQFENLENEIVRLKTLTVELHPILVIIQEIDEIERNFEEVQREHDPKSYTSRDRSCALQLMKEEKARRRHKVMIPKLNKKLVVLLNKYKEEKGQDFEWDGRPYIEKIEEQENQAKIEKRFGVIRGIGSVPPPAKKGSRRNENANQAQYAASLKPASARRAVAFSRY